MIFDCPCMFFFQPRYESFYVFFSAIEFKNTHATFNIKNNVLVCIIVYIYIFFQMYTADTLEEHFITVQRTPIHIRARNFTNIVMLDIENTNPISTHITHITIKKVFSAAIKMRNIYTIMKQVRNPVIFKFISNLNLHVLLVKINVMMQIKVLKILISCINNTYNSSYTQSDQNKSKLE